MKHLNMFWPSFGHTAQRRDYQPQQQPYSDTATPVSFRPSQAAQLLAALPLPAMLVTPAGQVVDANAAMATLLDLSNPSLLQGSVFDVVNPLHHDTCIQMLAQLRRTPAQPEMVELALVSATGTMLLVRMQMVMNELTSPYVLVTCESLQDSLTLVHEVVALTAALEERNAELVRISNELQEAQRQCESMSNMLVHDIRGPLVATSASLEIIQRGLASTSMPPMISEAIAAGMRGLRTVVDLTNDLLDMRKLAAGYQPSLEESCSVDSLYSDLQSTLHALIAQRQGRIVVKHDTDGLLLRGDGRLIRRVVFNIVTNAIRFTPQGGMIVLAAHSQPDGFVFLTIDDQGPGIVATDRERIFRPFEQGAGESRRGTGLGLAFCREVVQAHGGTIWVEDAPGGGSRFCIRLPQAITE